MFFYSKIIMKQSIFAIFIFFLIIYSINSQCDAQTQEDCVALNENPSDDDVYRCCWKKIKHSIVGGITGDAGFIPYCEQTEFQNIEKESEIAIPGYKLDIDCSSKYLISASLILLILLA